MTEMAPEVRARNLRTIAALAALFLLPLIASFWLYYGTDWRPAGMTNHGELIYPPRNLLETGWPELDGAGGEPGLFRREWTVVYIGSGACDEACRNALYVMRQTRLALNKDMKRVKRVFLATGDCCARDFLEREHPGLRVIDASVPEAAPLLREFPETDRDHTLFIVDPLGNLMMRYDARQDPKGFLEDLRKLLKLSHIG